MKFWPTAFLVLIAHTFAFGATDYLRDVKPVLAENCYRCHGASQQKGGLRLDTAALAIKGGDNGPALKLAKPAESLMVQAIKGTHADLPRMPYKKPPLSESQIALIESWIAEGAKAPQDEKPEAARHWAFVPLTRPPPPKVSDTTWPRNPIDFFILARSNVLSLMSRRRAAAGAPPRHTNYAFGKRFQFQKNMVRGL